MDSDMISVIPASAPTYMGGAVTKAAEVVQQQTDAIQQVVPVGHGVVLKKYVVKVLHVSEWETNMSALVDVYCVSTPDVLDIDGDWALQPFTHKIKSNIHLGYDHPACELLVKGYDLQVESTGLSSRAKDKPLVDKRSGEETPIHPFMYINQDTIVRVEVDPLIYGGVDHAVSVRPMANKRMHKSNKKGPGLAKRLWNALFPKD